MHIYMDKAYPLTLHMSPLEVTQLLYFPFLSNTVTNSEMIKFMGIRRRRKEIEKNGQYRGQIILS